MASFHILAIQNARRANFPSIRCVVGITVGINMFLNKNDGYYVGDVSAEVPRHVSFLWEVDVFFLTRAVHFFLFKL